MKYSWGDFVKTQMTQPYFKELGIKLRTERKIHTVYPEPGDTFTFMKLTPFDKVKVVIIGQDPYHGEGEAHGLAFSVRNNRIPPSLRNIFLELKDDLNFLDNGLGDLSPWARQGVLLMNSSLSVRKDNPGSHSQLGWSNFTDGIIKALSEYSENPIVYLLWGNHAKMKIKFIKDGHPYLMAAHPSPLSAHRGFFGCRHFSKTNSILNTLGKDPINWQL